MKRIIKVYSVGEKDGQEVWYFLYCIRALHPYKDEFDYTCGYMAPCFRCWADRQCSDSMTRLPSDEDKNHCGECKFRFRCWTE